MQPSKPKPQEITYHKCTHAHTHKHIRLSVCLAVCLSVCVCVSVNVCCMYFSPLLRWSLLPSQQQQQSQLFVFTHVRVCVCVWPPVIVIVYVNLGIFSPILYASVAVTATNKLCTKHFRLKCKNNWKATGITFKYQQTNTHTQARVRYRTIESFPCVWVCDQATKEKTTLTHLQPIVAGIQLARAAFLQFLISI